MGSITSIGGFSHWNKDRSKILFRSQQLHSSTSNGLSVLQCFEGTEFVIHLQEIIPTGRLYIRLLVFWIPGIKIKKIFSFFFPSTEQKSLFQCAHSPREVISPNFNISIHSLKFKFIKGLNFLNTFRNNKKQLHSSCRGVWKYSMQPFKSCHFMYILNFHLLNEYDHYWHLCKVWVLILKLALSALKWV